MFSRTLNLPVVAANRSARLARPTRSARSRRACRGFTLVELMIVVVIMGVLLAVAYPSYLDSVRKGRRAEGIAALTTVQQAQERFRANNRTYGNLNAPADADTLLNVKATSANDRYNLAVTGNSETGYTVTATAAGAQAADTACGVMGVRAAGGNLRYGSGAAAIDWAAADADAGKCWAK